MFRTSGAFPAGLFLAPTVTPRLEPLRGSHPALEGRGMPAGCRGVRQRTGADLCVGWSALAWALTRRTKALASQCDSAPEVAVQAATVGVEGSCSR